MSIHSAEVVGCMLLVLTACMAAAEEPLARGNVFGLPDEAMDTGGALVLGGGGQLPDAVYDEFVRLAGGADAELVLIPSAYPYDNKAHVERAFRGWKEYDVASFEFLHTDDPDEADSPRFCQALNNATGVWLAGGAQGRLVDRYGGRRVEKLLRRVVARGGVVGGTSAGASVQSQLMIRYGSATEAFVETGFGLTSKLVIDQHFSERGRFPRLLGVLEENLDHIGLGIDEDTAVIVQGPRVRVLGDGKATLCFGPLKPGGGTIIHRLSEEDDGEVSLNTTAGSHVYSLQAITTSSPK